MGRFIKFRGFCEEDWQWHYGDLLTWCNAGNPQIKDWSTENFKDFDVVGESVGQFTGFSDRNGVQLFEGDLVETDSGTFSVEYDEKTGGVDFVSDDGAIRHCISGFGTFRIVGNAFNDVDATERPKSDAGTTGAGKHGGCVVVDMFGRYLTHNLYRWSVDREDARVFADEDDVKNHVPGIWGDGRWKIVNL